MSRQCQSNVRQAHHTHASGHNHNRHRQHAEEAVTILIAHAKTWSQMWRPAAHAESTAVPGQMNSELDQAPGYPLVPRKA